MALCKLMAALVRAYANAANEMPKAGYNPAEIAAIKAEVTCYENLRNQVKIHSGDAIDLKRYEPAMRHLIDACIRAESHYFMGRRFRLRAIHHDSAAEVNLRSKSTLELHIQPFSSPGQRERVLHLW
jgi:hypothetical protein